MAIQYNQNELIFDKFISLTHHDLETRKPVFRLTSVEEPSLKVTTDSEEITDAYGSTITIIPKAKKAELSGKNSLFSLDLAAAQYGATKQIADSGAKLKVEYEEVIDVTGTSIQLSNKAIEDSIKTITVVNRGTFGKTYNAGSTATTTEFKVDYSQPKTKIELPTEVKTGSTVLVEYVFESEKAIAISNKTDEFTKAGYVTMKVIFRDVCSDKQIAGMIISPKAKLDIDSSEVALSPTGKHDFTYKMMKDYCGKDSELFKIVIFE